jgi:hypothetical protein
MRLFTEESLSNFLSQRLENLRQEVKAEDKNKLLNVNEAEYVDYLVSRYRVTPLNFQWKKMDITDKEVMIPAERYPRDFYVRRGESYPKQVFTFYIPFIGEKELLKYKPSSFLMWSVEVKIIDNNICLEVINWRDDQEQVMRVVQEERSNIQKQLENVLNDVVRYNQSLPHNAETIVRTRKDEHL